MPVNKQLFGTFILWNLKKKKKREMPKSNVTSIAVGSGFHFYRYIIKINAERSKRRSA
jgi:hypothetical protein